MPSLGCYGSCRSLWLQHLVGVGVAAPVACWAPYWWCRRHSAQASRWGLSRSGSGDDAAAELSQQLEDSDGSAQGC